MDNEDWVLGEANRMSGMSHQLTLTLETDGTMVLRMSARVGVQGKAREHFKLFEKRFGPKQRLEARASIQDWMESPDKWLRAAGWTPAVESKSGKQIPTDLGDLGL